MTTYVAFDGDKDIWAYRFLRGWSANKRIDFELLDAHDLDNMTARAQDEDYVKGKLRERMNRSKAFVLASQWLAEKRREDEMSALYIMRYIGGTGAGFGAIYIGKGTIVCVDVQNGRYHGTYIEQGDRVRPTVTLSLPQGGVLVTGSQVPPGTRITMTADWPANFADGQAQQIMVQGSPVQVTFEKIGDVP
jgi:hypothetical protein